MVAAREEPVRPRKVLLVSYYFPPSGGPGVQRVLKFTKYLPQFGWQPLVLTVREDADYPVLDPSLAAEIPAEAKIYRSGITEFYDLYRKITGKPKGASIDIQTVQREDAGWKDRLTRTLRGSLFIPDGRVGWYRSGVALGRRIIEEERPDAILASGPPFTTHWIGKTLAEASGVPLVLDFRDPWTHSLFYPARPGWARRLDERLESRCIGASRVVITVNRAMRDDLTDRVLPGLRGSGGAPELRIVPNGFDPEDFASLAPGHTRSNVITHVGSVFASRIPWTFLEVFERWVAEREERSVVRLVFAGRLAPELETRLDSPGLRDFVERPGYLSHRESLSLMRDAGLLLLLTGSGEENRGMLTGKVFEYLGSGTPIFALAPEGEAETLLEDTGAGFCARPDDAHSQAALLERWWEVARQGERIPIQGTGVERYSRRSQAEEVSRILRDVASRESRL